MSKLLIAVSLLLLGCGDETQFSSDYLNSSLLNEKDQSIEQDQPETPPVPVQATETTEEEDPIEDIGDVNPVADPEPSPLVPETPEVVISPSPDTNIPPGSTNLVMNGDFSYPTLNRSWNLFHSGNMDLALFAWQFSFTNSTPCGLENGSQVEPVIELQRLFRGSNQYLEMDSHCLGRVDGPMKTNLEIWQSIQAPQGQYRLSFTFKDRKHGQEKANLLRIRINEEVFTADSESTWSTVAMDITVNHEVAELEISFADEGPADTFGILLDDISLVKLDNSGP